MKDEYIKPTFQTKRYKSNEVVRCFDRYQQFLYVKHNAYPVDMYVDSRENLVMVFDKKETKDLYEKYRKYELK